MFLRKTSHAGTSVVYSCGSFFRMVAFIRNFWNVTKYTVDMTAIQSLEAFYLLRLVELNVAPGGYFFQFSSYAVIRFYTKCLELAKVNSAK